jgi:hypothetical protein
MNQSVNLHPPKKVHVAALSSTPTGSKTNKIIRIPQTISDISSSESRGTNDRYVSISICKVELIISLPNPVRIRVTIDPPHPQVCRKGAVLRMRPKKNEVPCHSLCGTIKIPPCSKALSAEHRPKFCSHPPAMVTSPYK